MNSAAQLAAVRAGRELMCASRALASYYAIQLARAERYGRDSIEPCIDACANAIGYSRRHTIRAKAQLVAAGRFTAEPRHDPRPGLARRRQSDRIRRGSSTTPARPASFTARKRPPRWHAYLYGVALQIVDELTARPPSPLAVTSSNQLPLFSSDTHGTANTGAISFTSSKSPLFSQKSSASSIAEARERIERRRNAKPPS